jgi:2-oxoglutarate dehydrogenase E2 component (dihydrolipoamide succinyltransferase)
MATQVVMPQMGESIAEGTIVRWIKKIGDNVDRDEPLFEISTDKVDAEIPSPAAGVLTEIKVREGETVPVNSVVATIAQAGEAPSTSAPPAHEAPSPTTSREATPPAEGAAMAAASTQSQADGQASAQPMPAAQEAARPTPAADRDAARSTGAARMSQVQDAARPTPGPQTAGGDGESAGRELTRDELRRQRSSPLVRRIAREHNVDITRIPGSGIGGRVTKHDILDYLDRKPIQAPTPVPAARIPQPAPTHVPAYHPGDRVEIQPLSVMRRKIAEHMILSRRTSAHVHSVFHVNFSSVEKIRQAKKAEYERLGAKLTFMSFIAKTVVDALRRHPVINASIDGDNVVYKKDINLGIAVALDNGLIVPVIRNADEKNMLGLSRAIADVANRARSKQLKADEVQGGTFTITNPGQFGAQFGMPIINQPQVAILGIGTIEKRPIVVDDAIAIRTMAYLTLGYDHRLVDGAVADEFMADVKQLLENFDSTQV